MHLFIKSIEVDGHIIAVKLSAYDIDGQEGVYIPGSEDINALKEVGAWNTTVLRTISFALRC